VIMEGYWAPSASRKQRETPASRGGAVEEGSGKRCGIGRPKTDGEASTQDADCKHCEPPPSVRLFPCVAGRPPDEALRREHLYAVECGGGGGPQTMIRTRNGGLTG